MTKKMLAAKEKNSMNLCGYAHCNNQLSSPPNNGFMGIDICKECDDKATEIVRGLKETPRDSWVRFVQSLKFEE